MAVMESSEPGRPFPMPILYQKKARDIGLHALECDSVPPLPALSPKGERAELSHKLQRRGRRPQFTVREAKGQSRFWAAKAKKAASPAMMVPKA